MEQSCLRHHSCYSELGHSLSSGTRRSLTRGGRKLLLRIVLKGAAASLLLPMPRHPSWRFYFLTHLQVKERADERTRTASCSLRVIHQALQSLAGVCKSRISRPISLLCLAQCCTVLRSRWCQSGVNIASAPRFRLRG